MFGGMDKVKNWVMDNINSQRVLYVDGVQFHKVYK